MYVHKNTVLCRLIEERESERERERERERESGQIYLLKMGLRPATQIFPFQV